MSVNFTLDSFYWNTTRNCGMREIFCSNDRFPLSIVECAGPEYEPHYRPTDIPKWRENLSTLFADIPDCLEMWLTALNEFETDTTLYFTISY